MFQIEAIYVVPEIKDVYFSCNLSLCKGRCCQVGELGPLVTAQEVKDIEQHLSFIMENLPENQNRYIQEHHFYQTLDTGYRLHLLYDNGPCIFATESSGTWFCALHNAELLGIPHKIKPLSCELFPLKLIRRGELEILTYVKQDECIECFSGKVKMYRYLKDALIRAFGNDWYSDLCNQFEE